MTIQKTTRGYHLKPNEFKEQIVEWSKADTWDKARKEWEIQSIYFESDGTCLCGKHPIVEHCVMFNSTTGVETVVGNECVKKFFEEKYDSAFRWLKKYKANNLSSFKIDVVERALWAGCINGREMLFYGSVHGLSDERLSVAQSKWKTDINKRVAKFVAENPKKAMAPITINKRNQHWGVS